MELYRGRRRPRKDIYVVTILARDRPGIIFDVTSLAAEMGINIEKALVTARGELISIEFIMDFSECSLQSCRESLMKGCERLGLDIVIQKPESSRKEKKLIVFDMDMTIVDFEIINKLADFVGVDEEVKSITEKAMRGEMDFEESLRQRVRLLKGTPISTLEEIAGALQLTPGSEDLIHHLKESGLQDSSHKRRLYLFYRCSEGAAGVRLHVCKLTPDKRWSPDWRGHGRDNRCKGQGPDNL